MRFDRTLIPLVGALALGACQNASLPDAIPNQQAPTDAGGSVTAQAVYYCWGSWRGYEPTFDRVTNQQFGGSVPIAGAQAMLDECKNRIKNDSFWRNDVCVGMGAGTWTVHTSLRVSECANVSSDPPNCLNNVGTTGFSNQCVDGQLGTIFP